MKNTLLLVGFAIALGSVAGCKKNKKEKISEDDAAEVVSESMQLKSGGMADDIQKSSYFISGIATGDYGPLTCGVALDTSNTYTLTGNGIAASYTHNRTYLLTCNNNIPVSISMTGNHHGSYDGPRLLASTTGSRNWIVTGLEVQSSSWNYSGSLQRSGTYTSKVGNQRTFNTQVNVSTSNVIVSKNNHTIQSGSSNITISCVASDGETYNYNGTLVFNGNGSATLTINGNVYQITF